MRLLLLPGLNGSNRLFAPLLACLPDSVPVECLELPEHGPQDYRSLADSLYPRLGNAPFALLGESFSGPLARMLARRNPVGLRGVIFAATFASQPNPLLSLLRLLPLPPPSLLAQRSLIRQFCAGRDAPEALVALIRDEIRRMPGALVRSRLAVLAELRETNEPLASPCLSLVPSSDRLVTKRARIGIANGCDSIRTKEIDGPHFLLQTRAAPCATAIMAFLDELS